METPVPEDPPAVSWRFTTIVCLSVIVILLTLYCLQNGIQTIFTHIYYVPIILAAYWYQKKGVVYSAGMGILYLALVIFMTGYIPENIVAAITRVAVFIIIAAVVTILSSRVSVQRHAIDQSEKKFRTIWEHIQAGIIVIDAASHEIISVNPEGERLTGYTEKEMLGKTCHHFICPAEKGRCPISDLGMTIDRSERVLLNKDGRSVPVLKTVTATTIDGRNVLIENYVRIPAASVTEKHE